MTLTQGTAKQLILARYVLQQAEGALKSANSFSAGVAISLVQDAVELMILAIARALRVDSREQSFMGNWQAIEKAPDNEEKIKLPLHSAMAALNKIRVNFKHYGVLPDADEVVRHSAYAREFFEIAVRDFFGVELETISLVDLIRDSNVREQLTKAEIQLANGQYRDCAHSCATAVYYLRRYLSTLVQPSPNISLRVPMDLRGDMTRLGNEIGSVLANHGFLLTALVTGTNPVDMRRFAALTPSAQGFANNPPQLVTFGILTGYMYTAGDASFCVRYVHELAMKLQEIVPFSEQTNQTESP